MVKEIRSVGGFGIDLHKNQRNEDTFSCHLLCVPFGDVNNAVTRKNDWRI